MIPAGNMKFRVGPTRVVSRTRQSCGQSSSSIRATAVAKVIGAQSHCGGVRTDIMSPIGLYVEPDIRPRL